VKFYHVHWCPECEIVRTKLDELGIQYESVVVADQRPRRTEVYEASGQYYVPVLQDEDKVLTETRDILSYLESQYGPHPNPLIHPFGNGSPGERER
jgi:glutathione S-transferase